MSISKPPRKMVTMEVAWTGLEDHWLVDGGGIPDVSQFQLTYIRLCLQTPQPH